MNKLVLLVLFISTQKINSQESSSKLFQKVTAGGIFGTFAYRSITDETKNSEKPFSVGYNISANVSVVTPKTYHNLIYGFGNNSFRSLNGYFLPNNWDTYLVYGRTLHTQENYLGAGIEKMIKIENKGEGVKFFLFLETGNNFTGNQSLTVGMLVIVQNRIWKQK